MHAYLITKGSSSLRIKKIEELAGFNYLEDQIDVILLDVLEGKKQISIDQVKSAIKESVYKPINRDYKYIIIHNAKLLTHESQNALLKSLEEPYDHIKFFLETDHEKNILDTITSRCLKIYCDEVQSESIINVNAVEFVNGNIGTRLDLLQKLKTKLDTREDAVEFIGSLIITQHDILRKSAKDINKLKNIRYQINLLSKIKNNVEQYNVNIFLALENIAINL